MEEFCHEDNILNNSYLLLFSKIFHYLLNDYLLENSGNIGFASGDGETEYQCVTIKKLKYGKRLQMT